MSGRMGPQSRPPSNAFAYSLKLAEVFGIPIYIHWTFWILILWIAITSALSGESTAATVTNLTYVAALFSCVLLHELGHALAAKRYGVKTNDITLLPIGGVARLQSIPEKPWEEFIIAIAGPAVNVVIAGILYLVGARVQFDFSDERFLLKGNLLDRMLLVNLILVLFNLLPAFPMDGGRILRALLAMVMDYGRATALAARIGQLMALLFVFVGLQYNPFLILIAFFVWIGANNEAAMVGERIALRDVSVRSAMLTDFSTLRPDDTLGQAVELLLAGTQQDFPVIEGGRITSVLTRARLLDGLSRAGRDAPVADFALSDIVSVDVSSPLTPAIAMMRERGLPCAQVTENGRTVGLITPENVAEYLLVKSALTSHNA